MISDADSNPTRSDSGVRVVRTAHGTRHVELWGTMPVGWLGNFTRGATRLNLDIVRGQAQRGNHRSWTANFEMRGTAEAALEPVDFLALARDASEASASELALELQSFDLGRSSERVGTLELHIRAPDHVGFLASLLELLAGFVLFPEKVSIDTFQNEAKDAFWLSSVGGQSPPAELEGALRAALRSCMRDRSSLFPGA